MTTINKKQLRPNVIRTFFALLKKDFLVYSPFSYKGSIKNYILKIFFIFVLLFGIFVIWKYIINIYQINFHVLNAVVPGYIFLYLIVSVLQVAFSSQSITFLAKDESLQVLPINPVVIYASRITSKLINEFLKTVLFMFPFFIALYHSTIPKELFGNQFVYYLRVLFITLTLPITSVFLGSIFQPTLVYLREIVKKSNFVYLALITIISVIVVVLFVVFISGFLDDFGYIRTDVIKKRWYKYDRSLSEIFNGGIITKYLYPIIYKNRFTSTVGVKFTRLHLGKHFLIIFGINALLIGLAVLVIVLTYYDLINISKTASNRETKPNKLFLKQKSLFSVFFKKEFILFWRRKEFFRNQVLYYFLGPITLFVVNFILSRFDLNFYGVRIAVVINIVINLLLVCLANFMASVAFTADGKVNDTIKKILPNTKKLIHAKLLFSLLNLLFITSLSFLVMAFFNPFQKYLKLALLFIFVISIIYGLLHLLIAFFTDLQNHHKNYNSELIESKSVTATIVWAIGITILVLIGHFVFGLKKIYKAQALLIGFGLIGLLVMTGLITVYMKVVLNRPEDYLHE